MKNILLITLLAVAFQANAQKYFTRTGYVGFYSHTSVEDIKADNNKASVVLDASTGQIEIACLIKSFEFEKALMQEHFNENYMESSTYPKSVFKGKVQNMSAINLKKDGTYTSKVTGELEMHGVKKTITVDATFKVSGGKVTCETKFTVNPKDYNITIPDVVKGQISENIEVTVKATLEELQK